MAYCLSDSQREVLRLESVVGSEVNTLAFSVLFCSFGNDEVLKRAAWAVREQYPELSVSIDRENECQWLRENEYCEQDVVYFSSAEAFESWSAAKASESMDIEESCVELIPISIGHEIESKKREGFFVRVHHAAADGWAASLLLRDLSECYRALRQDRKPSLAECFAYEEFVEAEKKYHLSKRGQKDAAFWRDFLADSRNGNLLSDKTAGNFSSKRYSVSFDAEIAAQLKEAIKSRGRTLLSVMMTVVSAAYSRMEETEKFCVGTIFLNRTNTREQNMMGNCFSTVPLPVVVGEGETFESLNEGISDSLFAALRRQRTSYSRLIAQAFEDAPERPLFDVLINCQDYTAIDTADMEFIWYPPVRQLETLQIGLVVTNETMQIHYDYRPNCIDGNKVAQLHTRIEAVLEDVLSGGWEKPIAALKQITEVQIRQVEEWNHTEHEYPKSETLYSLFEKQLAVRADQTALFCGEETMSYVEFERCVRNLAAYLTDCGVTAGQIVGIMADRSFEMMIGIYAIIRCGAAYMPIGTDTPQDRVLFMLQDSKSPVLLTQSWQCIELPQKIGRIDLDSIYLSKETEFVPSAARAELPAYVIYTSGSTGMPKGVLISHRSIVDRIHWMNRLFGMNEKDVILQKTPYTFDVSVWELFWWSNYGASLAILPPEAHKDPEQIIGAMRKYRVTKMHFVPSMLSAFLTYAEVVDIAGCSASLQQVFASGEALMPTQVQKFYRLFPKAELINLYGPTECTVDVSCFRCPKEMLKSIPIGKPVDNTSLYVLDKNLQMLPIGAAGELCVTGNLVGIGYLNRPELTKERFVANPFGEGKMYRTGDLVYWNTDGEIEYLGRLDFQVKLRGQRLELGEIERSMVKITGIREAVASVQHAGSEDAQLVAHYTGRSELPAVMIRQSLEKSLPAYMIPQGFMYLPQFPLTVSGKTDRKRLPVVQVEKSDCETEFRPPETELQKKLCGAFAHALQIPESEVGILFHFFEQGGTSLRAIALLTELFAEHPIQLKDIYEHPTPEKLAEFIECSEQIAAAKREEDDYSQERAYVNIDTPVIGNVGIPQGKCGFITGTTGFLGVHLLHDLLMKHGDTSFICLVRSADKLKRHWTYMFADEPFPQERIITVTGDISKEKLGMSEQDYRMCVLKAAAVFHCAADVRHFGQWETSYAVNTLGTQHVIDLCLAADAALHHISTMSVNGYVLTTLGEKLSDEFTENHLFIGQRYRENVYAHSKYLAEKKIIDARSNGLRANIYRVGNLLWRTKDGKFQKNREAHDFYMLTHAFLDLETVPCEFAQLEVDLTSVDSCAAAICTLSGSALGQIYHLINPNMLSLYGYLQSLSEKELKQVTMTEFKQVLHKRAEDPKFGFLLAYTAANEMSDSEMFPVERNRKTVAKLAELGFEWEIPTVEYARYVL